MEQQASKPLPRTAKSSAAASPMAKPAMPCSQRGVLNTLSAPNSSRRPICGGHAREEDERCSNGRGSKNVLERCQNEKRQEWKTMKPARESAWSNRKRVQKWPSWKMTRGEK